MKFKVFATQGQGDGGAPVMETDTLEEALAYVKAHEGHASFAIEKPDGSFHRWHDDLPSSVMLPEVVYKFTTFVASFGGLTKLPIYDPDPRLTMQRDRANLHAEGRAARRAGLPDNHATGNFANDSLRLWWSVGWRTQDEELKGWRDPKTGLPTELGVKNGL